MMFEIYRDQASHAIRFSGEITVTDLVTTKLDSFDNALLRDVGRDTEATAADHLLALEVLFRRAIEQRQNALPASPTPGKEGEG